MVRAGFATVGRGYTLY